MFYSTAKCGTPPLFWTRTILDVRSLAGYPNYMNRTRVSRRPNTLINDREPIAGLAASKDAVFFMDTFGCVTRCLVAAVVETRGEKKPALTPGRFAVKED